MLILLPPSETKRDGGMNGSRLDLDALSFPTLKPARRKALAGLRSISSSIAASTKALGLGPTQRFEIDRNRAITSSPTMPAIARYTGVLYDAINVETLDAEGRGFLDAHVVIHSALFGLIRAGDPIPAYRFSHDTRMPATSLSKLWREANAAVLDAEPGLVLDLRSESYVHLGPASDRSLFLRVVSDDGSGHRRALNHFNKHGKGELVRALAGSAIDFESVPALLEWARSMAITLASGTDGELDLVV
ncbi:MAG TPA: peroxide stress protein YaaA [Galbitalea sp.]|nr:peroxide stress protein YaaA [Galbitalea sp.]